MHHTFQNRKLTAAFNFLKTAGAGLNLGAPVIPDFWSIPSNVLY
jgi:hypothetical protein